MPVHFFLRSLASDQFLYVLAAKESLMNKNLLDNILFCSHTYMYVISSFGVSQ